MDSRKTIFITVDRAGIARNLFFNNFAGLLRKKYRVIIFSSMYNDKEFLEKLPQYEILPLYEIKMSALKRKIEGYFISLHKSLIYNSTVEIRTKYGLMRRSDTVRFKKIRVFIQKYIFGSFLSKFSFIKEFMRKLDSIVFPCKLYDQVIDQYKPDLVFISVITSNEEVALLRNCKAKGVKSIGMPKSWDTISKFGFREKADKMVVWSEFMKEELKKFQNYQEEDIRIVGIPQFDYYKSLGIPANEEFFNKYKLNINKKTIFFGSEGPVCESDPYIVEFLNEKILDGILKDYQIFVRPHYSYKDDEKRFMQFDNSENVIIDFQYKRSKSKDRLELSLNNLVNLIASVRYSDVCITSASTLVLDIAANEKYPILYDFDREKDIPYRNSTARLYETTWMKEITRMNLDNIVHNEEELIVKIKEVENNPDLKLSEREEMIRRLCYKLDGKSAVRLYNYLDENINN